MTLVTEFFSFNEGQGYVNAYGLPATVYFLLSGKGISDFSPTDTLEGGVGEITGTGYERVAQPTPPWWPPWSAESYQANFTRMEWTTGTARDWPAEVGSFVLVTSPDDSEGVAVGAWSLQKGGAPRNMANQFVTVKLWPTISVANPTFSVEKAGTST